jgi:predicted RNA-binding protein with PIN domain
MNLLIDGHNLIPKIRGMSLRAMDDEQELIAQLQDYCRIKRAHVEVFFDGAPAGFSGKRFYGQIAAHFVRKGTTADDAITDHLRKLGKNARNWTVVSSDRRVQAEARACQAQVISSENFFDMLRSAQDSQRVSSKPGEQRLLSDDEVNEWLDLFKK